MYQKIFCPVMEECRKVSAISSFILEAPSGLEKSGQRLDSAGNAGLDVILEILKDKTTYIQTVTNTYQVNK